jgi:MFS family permease
MPERMAPAEQGEPRAEGAALDTAKVAAAGSVYPAAWRAWVSALVIFMLTTIGLADRMAIAMLIGPIKRDFGIGDFQASLLVGLAFTLFYVLFLIPAGIAADRLSRKAVLGCGLLIWSLATIACGFAGSFVSLFVLRMIVGTGEAVIGPCSHGIIGDSFPRHALSKPLALQGIGFQAGPAAGMAAAGAILTAGAAGAFANWPLLGDLAAWRVAFILIGVPGLLVLPLIALLHEPPRSALRSVEAARPVALQPFLKQNARLMWPVLGGAALSAMSLGAVTGWVPEYLQRSLGVSPAQAGASLGLILLVAAVVGQGLYAVAVDWFASRGILDAPVRIGLVPAALAIPCSWFAFAMTGAAQFYIALFVYLLCIVPFNALNNTTVQQIAPAPLRSRLSALLILVISVVGFAFAPALVGFLSEFVFGEARLGLAMQVVSTTSLVLAFIFYLAARRPLLNFMQKRKG